MSDTEALLLEMLDDLCAAHSPAGCEHEIDAVIERHLEGVTHRVYQDRAGNIIAHFRGRSSERPLLLNAHKDEIALVIKRVEDDGRLRVRTMGGAHPWKYGEGPVDLMADDGSVIPAALCFGSSHVSDESPISKVKSGQQGLTWQMGYLDAKLSRDELASLGVHAGTKVVLERSRKRPRRLGRHVCAHALDDKAGVALLLLLAQRLRGWQPAQDVHFVFSSMEEVDGGSAIFAARQIAGEAMLGLEIIPAVPEYGIKNDARPVLVHVDGVHVYDERLTRRAAALAGELGIELQHAVMSSFGSDPGLARRAGSVPRAVLFGFPADNTHGYEIANLDAMLNCLTLTEAFVRDWPSD